MDWTNVWTTASDPTLLLRVCVYLICARVVLASVKAAVNKEFDWRRLPEFLEHDIVYRGVGLILLYLLGLLDKGAMPGFQFAAAAFALAEVRRLWAHVAGS